MECVFEQLNSMGGVSHSGGALSSLYDRVDCTEHGVIGKYCIESYSLMNVAFSCALAGSWRVGNI